ncbi:MBL fold metallo-hydrolase [Clostridium amazonitimonense]|uniref:MBL fold metallo-hydrolase n=1 Tax=Clostridium amazonitimonense TaxID=1499689 RepID=UPI000509C059|nr:MBL fold metallo-hydrolase [Clostridium amazonitimonense]
MRINWIGHSCFLIITSENTSILVDPFEGMDLDSLYEVYPTIDVVTTSHKHFDHSYIDPFKSSSLIIDEAKPYVFKDLKIQGYSSYHDDYGGLKRGENIVYTISTENFNLCHFGDIGHIPSKELIEKIGDLTVLFIPVGGNTTLDGNKAYSTTKLIKSNIIIPMHYKTKNYLFLTEDASRFIVNIKNVIKHDSYELILHDSINKLHNQVVLLNSLQ